MSKSILKGLKVVPVQRKHLEQVCELMARTFSGRGYFNVLQDARDGWVGNSHYDWNSSRIGILDGQVVTHWGVWGLDMRVGSAVIKVAGVGAVATHDHYRGGGLMAITGHESIEAMARAKYDMSLLFGIDNYYDRFGYVRSWPDVIFFSKLQDLPQKKLKLQEFRPLVQDEFVELVNREYQGITGTAIRPTFLTRPEKDRTGYAWRDKGGKLRGYVIVINCRTHLECFEAAGDPDEVQAAMAILCRQFVIDEVRFVGLPRTCRLAARLREGNCRMELTYHRNGAAMMRTVSLRQCLGKLCGELSRRLAGSPLAGWTGQLLVQVDPENVLLDITGGEVRLAGEAAGIHCKNVLHAGKQMAQLLIGTDQFEETVRLSRIRTTGQARALGNVLFAEQQPMLLRRDRF